MSGSVGSVLISDIERLADVWNMIINLQDLSDVFAFVRGVRRVARITYAAM